jgi:hypothetical protein
MDAPTDTTMMITMIVLRIIHILSGVAWAGASFLTPLFLSPTAAALGPEGGKFMGHLTGKTKFTLYLTLAALFNVLAGYTMLYIKSNLALSWFLTGEGLGFGLGAVFGTIAFLIGFFVIRAAIEDMGKVGAAIQQGGGKPTPEQGAAMQKAQAQLSLGSKINAVALMLTVICMAAAAYLPVG